MLSYELLDCGDFKKLELIGNYKMVRPSPQAVWAPTQDPKQWEQWDAMYIRKSEGKGFWKKNRSPEAHWPIEVGPIKMGLQLTNFGHLGVFFEQVPNWLRFQKLVADGKKDRSEYNVLNLFAYTGGATLSCALAGANVVHLDASKSSNQWARENAALNQLEEAPIRWITDDVVSFVEREIRRGNKYQAIILDPPSFGRGAKGQVWKVEEDMVHLLSQLKKLYAEDFHFISLSSHSPGYSPLTLENLLSATLEGQNIEYFSEEMSVPFKNKVLPAGATCLAQRL